MQSYMLENVNINTGNISVPVNCAGASTLHTETTGQQVIFWFPNDDMTQADIDAIDAAVAAHKYGKIVVFKAEALNTYTVYIITDEISVTPIVDGVEVAPIAVVDGVASMDIVATETFHVDTVELDATGVTYYVN